MKEQKNSSPYGIAAMIALLLAMLTSYFGGIDLFNAGTIFAVASLIWGAVFTCAIAACITIQERNMIKKCSQ